MNEMRVRELGLAAFIKVKGATLLRVEDKSFYFQSDNTLSELQVMYHNSCCRQHDSELMSLRKLL